MVSKCYQYWQLLLHQVSLHPIKREYILKCFFFFFGVLVWDPKKGVVVKWRGKHKRK